MPAETKTYIWSGLIKMANKSLHQERYKPYDPFEHGMFMIDHPTAIPEENDDEEEVETEGEDQKMGFDMS